MKAKRNILVVDDEQDLCDILRFNLTTAGYKTETASSAEEALALGIERFDLVLLDVMMPGISGYELAARIKREPSTSHMPIIFLTAKDSEEDTLHGFALGADDYISKPFSIREVLARIKAVLGRTPQKTDTAVECYDGLTMNHRDKTVLIDGKNVSFTRTEFDLLWLLLTHQEKVFSRQQLIEEVWPTNVIVTDRTIDVNINRLRKKVGNYAANIVTRPGFGYCFQR